MLQFNDVLYGMLIPAGGALLGFVLAWLWRDATRLRWIASLGLAAGMASAYWMLKGLLPRPVRFPPIDSTLWVAFAAPVLVVVAILDSNIRLAWWLRLLACALLSAVLVGLLSRPKLEHAWRPMEGAAWLGGLTVAITLVCASAERAAQRLGGIAMVLVLAALAGGVALVVGMSGSQKIAQSTGALAAGMAAAIPIAIWRGKNFTLGRGGGAMLVALLASGQLVCGYFFAGVTPVNAALLLGAPLIAWAAAALPIKRHPVRSLLVIVAGITPIAAAVTLAFLQFRRDAAELGLY